MPIKAKKRKKSTRFRGTHTHGRGFKKKARGSGHRGGVGNAGTGKRADQKKNMKPDKKGKKYFGKAKVRRAARKEYTKTMTLRTIADNIDSLVKKGLAKESKGSYEVELKEYKVIGNDKVDVKLIVRAKRFTKGAEDALKTSGGEAVLIEVKKAKAEDKEE